MKPRKKKPDEAATESKPTADRTLHIEWPWSMTWMEYVDEMPAFLKSQIGPGHPLHGKKLYISAVNKDADGWYVEGEKEDFSEQAVKAFGPHDAVKEPNPEARAAGRALIAEQQAAGPNRRTFVFVNNRLEGNALATIAAMLEPGDS